MIIGTAPACEQTGFVALHADACAAVARQLDTCVLFREPGKSAQSLIADSYAMKGFRIDTKSCTWGPMRGFVCVDPRLSKQTSDGGSYADKNRVWTKEALEGHIVEKFFGKVDAEEAADWKADVMPIVLSRKRIDELAATGHISFKIERSGGGAEDLVGKSTAKFGKTEVTLPWRLKNAAGATNPWLKNAGRDYYVLCVDPKQGFVQELPPHVHPVLFRGFHTILGMCNPSSKQLGFKACVTADYDLFAIWPKKNDLGNVRHQINAAILARNKPPQAPLPPHVLNVTRMPHIDDRLQSQKHKEHYRVGDVSARVLLIKTMLNTAIISAGYRGGNAIHHNDEQGNMALAKGSLAECLPVLAIVPYLPQPVIALTGIDDFKNLVLQARTQGFDTRAKDSWLKEAGIPSI